jgi:CubicO group peptidase (beta-lactamase class C family)
LDSFILTAGGSRLFGLGYQLYPCFNKKQSTLPQYDETKTHSLLNFPNYQSFTSLTNKEKEKEEKNIKTLKKLNSTKKIQDEGYPIVQGLGHGDFGGSIGLCFPEKKLSIAILVNDMLTGSEASKTILNFILNYFGLVPCWETPYTMQSFITDMKSIIPTTFEAPPDEILATVDILTHQCTSNKT